jgi:hypothetical protein
MEGVIKTTIDFIQAHTVSELISIINNYNTMNPQNPILKEDIVDIKNDEGTYILLYYK